MADKIAALVLSYLNGNQSARLIIGDILNDESPYNNHPEVQYYVIKLHNTSTVLDYSFWYQFLMKMGQRSTRHHIGKEVRRLIDAVVMRYFHRHNVINAIARGTFWSRSRERRFRCILKECSKDKQVVSADS